MNKNKVLISLAVLSIISVATYGIVNVSKVYADSNKFSPLIQKIVDKFGLDQNEVDKVLTEFREERQTENKERVEERFAQAVKDGKITEEQKEKIIAKQEEWRSQNINSENMTQEERKTAMEKHRDEMQAWALENNIDLSFLMGQGMGPRGGDGMKMGEQGLGKRGNN